MNNQGIDFNNNFNIDQAIEIIRPYHKGYFSSIPCGGAYNWLISSNWYEQIFLKIKHAQT